MKKVIAASVLPLILAACQSTGDQGSMAGTVTAQDLQHHNWELTHIDGKAVVTPDHMQPPRLEIGENLTANGNAGCNNFFGQAELKDNQLKVEQMGMTMKMCMDGVMNTEAAFSKALTQWSDITLTKDSLTLKNSGHTLLFKLNDWK